MDKTKKISGAGMVLFMLIPIATALLTAMQTLMLKYLYDSEIFLYGVRKDFPKWFNKFPDLFNILTVLAVAVIFILCCLTDKENQPIKLPNVNSFVIFTAALTGFALAAMTIYNTIDLLKPEKAFIRQTDKYTILQYVIIFIAIPAFIYFITIAFSRDRKQNKRSMAIPGFFVIIWAVIYLLIMYFNMDTPLNSPVRIINQLSMITFMLYFVYEIRFLLSDPRPRLYLAFSSLAVLFLSVSSIPQLLLTITGSFKADIDTFLYFLEFACLLYIISRLTSYTLYREIREAALVKEPEIPERLNMQTPQVVEEFPSRTIDDTPGKTEE